MTPDNPTSESLAREAQVMSTKRIRSSHSLESLQLRLQDAELLLEVSRRMASFDQLDDVLRELVEMTTAAIGTEQHFL